jgi:exodeoxyribonuclease VII small subunit
MIVGMTTKSVSYQKLSAELDTVLGKLQGSELDVDEAVKAYERGVEIVGQLEAYLKAAENKVTKIKASFDSTK